MALHIIFFTIFCLVICILCILAKKKKPLAFRILLWVGGFLLLISWVIITEVPMVGFTDWKIVHEIQLNKDSAISDSLEDVESFLKYYELNEYEPDVDSDIVYKAKQKSAYIILTEDSAINNRVLQLYMREGQESFWWTTNTWDEEYKYVIRVPVGTINWGNNEISIEME